MSVDLWLIVENILGPSFPDELYFVKVLLALVLGVSIIALIFNVIMLPIDMIGGRKR